MQDGIRRALRGQPDNRGEDRREDRHRADIPLDQVGLELREIGFCGEIRAGLARHRYRPPLRSRSMTITLAAITWSMLRACASFASTSARRAVRTASRLARNSSAAMLRRSKRAASWSRSAGVMTGLSDRPGSGT